MLDRRRSVSAILLATSVLFVPASALATQDKADDTKGDASKEAAEDPKPKYRIRSSFQRDIQALRAAGQAIPRFHLTGPSPIARSSSRSAAIPKAAGSQRYTKAELAEIRTAQIEVVRQLVSGPTPAPRGGVTISHPRLGRIVVDLPSGSLAPAAGGPSGGLVRSPIPGLISGPSHVGGTVLGGPDAGTSDPSDPGGGSSPDDFPVLQPGSGFSGPTAQPPAVGNEFLRGYDAKAIARWDVVPYQDFDDLFHVGVVAFHMNGIDRVELSVEGGPWTPVTEMKLNPRTDVWEYTATLDASLFGPQLVELRARVFPRGAGEVRVLEGQITPDSVKSGNHSMFLRTGFDEAVFYVDAVNGDDSNDGSESNPMRSLAHAAAVIERMAAHSDRVTLNLFPGEYTLDTKVRNVDFGLRWLTIQPAEGLDRSTVVISDRESSSLGVNNVRLHNLSIHSVLRLPFERLWLDDIEFDGLDLTNGSKAIAGSWSPNGIWITDGSATNSRNVLRGANFYRNHHVIRTSGSPFGGSNFVLSSRVDEYVLTDFHGNVSHWTVGATDSEHVDADANTILYGIDAPEFPTQGLFAEVFPHDLIGTPVFFNNVAIVDVSMDATIDDYRGGWWETATNHLLMWNVQSPRHIMRWTPDKYATTDHMKNVSIRDSTFYAFAASRLPDDTEFVNVSFTDPDLHGAWIPEPSGD